MGDLTFLIKSLILLRLWYIIGTGDFMKESDLNRIVFSSIRSLADNTFSEKISDASPTQKPFDGIACFENAYWNIESKLIKGEFTSFNLKKVEDHQIRNLQNIRIQMRGQSGVKSIVLVGYYVPRKLFGFFLFDIDVIIELLSKDIFSIKKKDILSLRGRFFIEICSVKQPSGKREYLVDTGITWEEKIIGVEDVKGLL